MSDGSKPTDGMKVLRWIVLIVVAAIAGAIGSSLGDEASRSVLGESTSDVLERAWRPAVVGVLSVELPEPLERVDIPMSAQDRSDVASLTRTFEAYQSTAGSVDVRVSHVEYQAQVTVDLRGAAEGAVQRSMSTIGVVDPSVTYTETTVSGLPALRAVVQFTAEGKPARSESLTVSRGQRLWLIQTIFPDSPAGARVSERILGSVVIAS